MQIYVARLLQLNSLNARAKDSSDRVVCCFLSRRTSLDDSALNLHNTRTH